MGSKEFPGTAPHGGFIRISFSFAGKRYRPVLKWKPTPQNFAKASALYLEVRQLIQTGAMTHRLLCEYFPDLIDTSRTVSKTPVFAELAQSYLDSTDVSVNTRNEYKKTLNRYWMPALAAVPVDEIKASEIRTILSGTDWQSGKTRNNTLSVLRRVFEFAVDDELIRSNPCDKIKAVKHQKIPLDPFTEAEADAIVADLYQRHEGLAVVYACYFEFAFWTGMRTSELMALTWGDIDWNARTARVNKAQSKGRLNSQTKTGKTRDVMLNDRALSALVRMKPLTFMGGGVIFRSPRTGNAWMTDKSPRGPFYDSLRRLGIRQRRAYNTRHTCATMMLMKGVNPAFAAAQLGHSLQMFMTTYAKWIHGEASQNEVEKMNGPKIGPRLAQEKSR